MTAIKKHWRHLPIFAPPQVSSANDPLTVAAMKAWRLREPISGRSYTVVKLESRGGTVGFGEGGALRAADVTTARSVVIGRLATESEFVRNALAAIPALEAAVNNAMLDLMGRAKHLPVYQYLGGPTRHKARVLARLEGDGEDALIESLRRPMDQGFRAFSFPIPGRDALWRMQAYTDAIRARLSRLKAAAGNGTDFVLDAGATLTPGDASFIATALERAHLLWLDEPTPVLSSDALSRISDESVMPLGLGRHLHDVGAFQNLLRWGCVDILRPDIGLNSIPKIRRIAAIAETHYVAVGPYHNGGPINSVAAIHLAASLPNFFIQQIPQPSAERDRAMRAEIAGGNHESAVDGFAQLLNKPGLGIEVNEQALGKYSEEVI
jgi:galactonate dehydratase